MAEFIVGILIGLVFASIYEAWRGLPRELPFLERIKAFLAASSQSAKAEPASPAPDILPPENAAEPLTVKLQKLEAAFSPSSENAAHPREFLDLPPFREAAALLSRDAVPLKTVLQYAIGTNWALSCAGLAALAQRPDGADAQAQVLSAFDRLAPWAMHYALSYFLTLREQPAPGAPFVNAKEWWRDNPVVTMAAREYFDEVELWGDTPSFGEALDTVPAASYAVIRNFLERLHHAVAVKLIQEIAAKQRTAIDRTFLCSFGRFWGDSGKLDLLIEPAAWSEQLRQAETAVTGHPFRPLLVTGETRIGKTSFLRLLGKRLEGGGWTVFEAGGAELMAGQQYFGQLEGRIQKAVEELSAAKKLIWYIPDILQIALSGTHQGQAASVLEQILPAISAGRLIVWTEASAAGAARLLRMRPQLRNVFEVVRFEPLSKEETLTIANAVAARVSAESNLTIDPACAETALSAARQYLSGTGLPGSVLDLLKSAIARAIKDKAGVVTPCPADRFGEVPPHSVSLPKGREDARIPAAAGSRVPSPLGEKDRMRGDFAKQSTAFDVTPNSVIMSLSQATGVPVAILDSKERADLASIRNYFAARVMGQDEAVATIVD
ncbi:MAG: AAA family ATPase, partial [Rhodomicrobium sp.]